MASISDSHNTESKTSAGPMVTQKKQKLGSKWKLQGAAVYLTSYNKNKTECKQAFDCVSKSSVSDQHIYSTPCKRDVSVAHQGIADIRCHIERKTHKSRIQSLKNQTLINFRPRDDPLHDQVKPSLNGSAKTLWFNSFCMDSCSIMAEYVSLGGERIIGCSLPPLGTIYRDHCLAHARKIISDPQHPAYHPFAQLPSGRRFCSTKAKSARFSQSM